jgi:hypothetical protein
MWLRVTERGDGEICATHGSFLFAAVRLLAGGTTLLAREKLAAGVWLPATFGWHRPHWDACLTQYWRTARKFDPEQYVAALAESGFTHCEVNGLQAHMPVEDFVPFEYYPQFYSYCPGFNHFVDTELTRGIWPAMYPGTKAQSSFPMEANPTVTAGFRWAPLNAFTQYTANVTAIAQPAVITIQPEACPFVCRNTTFATTPSPSRTSNAVPKPSARNGFITRLHQHHGMDQNLPQPGRRWETRNNVARHGSPGGAAGAGPLPRPAGPAWAAGIFVPGHV